MRFTTAGIFYGLADHSVQEVIDFYASREEAEETLAQIHEDEPGWVEMLEVWRLSSAAPHRTSARSK